MNRLIWIFTGGFDDNSPLDSCERYDTELDEWKIVAPMSCCRGGVGLATLGGRLYAVGGHDGSNYLNSVEAYDPLTDQWETIGGINTSRAGAGLSFCHCCPNYQEILSQMKNVDSLHCM